MYILIWPSEFGQSALRVALMLQVYSPDNAFKFKCRIVLIESLFLLIKSKSDIFLCCIWIIFAGKSSGKTQFWQRLNVKKSRCCRNIVFAAFVSCLSHRDLLLLSCDLSCVVLVGVCSHWLYLLLTCENVCSHIWRCSTVSVYGFALPCAQNQPVRMKAWQSWSAYSVLCIWAVISFSWCLCWENRLVKWYDKTEPKRDDFNMNNIKNQFMCLFTHPFLLYCSVFTHYWPSSLFAYFISVSVVFLCPYTSLRAHLTEEHFKIKAGFSSLSVISVQMSMIVTHVFRAQ